MKKRWLALALLGALALGCAVPVLAEETEQKENTVQAENSAAGPDDREDRKNYVPDEVGFISFENIERRMRKENLKIQMNWKNWNLRCIHKDRRSLRRTKGIRLFDRTIGQDNSGNSRYSLQPALRKKE